MVIKWYETRHEEYWFFEYAWKIWSIFSRFISWSVILFILSILFILFILFILLIFSGRSFDYLSIYILTDWRWWTQRKLGMDWKMALRWSRSLGKISTIWEGYKMKGKLGMKYWSTDAWKQHEIRIDIEQKQPITTCTSYPEAMMPDQYTASALPIPLNSPMSRQ